MKTLLYYPQRQKRHSLFDETTELLSNKYRLIYSPENRELSTITRLRNIPFFRKFYHRYIRNIVSLSDIMKKEEKIPLGVDLILASNQLPPEGYLFVLDLETVTALAHYNYDKLDCEYIKKRLESDECKAILCWNHASYESLTSVIDCSGCKYKIFVLPFAIGSGGHKRERLKHRMNLLFISSINNPQDFELKGGIIALEVFKEIKMKYPQCVLTIRSFVPERIKDIYKNVEDIIYIEKPVSDWVIEDIYSDTDILLEPLPGIKVLLECMKFGIPVVAFDYWEIPEMVKDNRSGFTLDCTDVFGDKKNFKEYLKKHHLNYIDLLLGDVPKKIIGEYSEKMGWLIESEYMRAEMGKYAKSLVSADGFYSLEKKNKMLLNVIEEALKK